MSLSQQQNFNVLELWDVHKERLEHTETIISTQTSIPAQFTAVCLLWQNLLCYYLCACFIRPLLYFFFTLDSGMCAPLVRAEC